MGEALTYTFSSLDPGEMFTFQLLAHLVIASHDRSHVGLARVPRPIAGPPPQDHSGRPPVQFTTPLRGAPPAAPEHTVGSLRNLTKSLDMIPGHAVLDALHPECKMCLGDDFVVEIM